MGKMRPTIFPRLQSCPVERLNGGPSPILVRNRILIGEPIGSAVCLAAARGQIGVCVCLRAAARYCRSLCCTFARNRQGEDGQVKKTSMRRWFFSILYNETTKIKPRGLVLPSAARWPSCKSCVGLFGSKWPARRSGPFSLFSRLLSQPPIYVRARACKC